MKKNEQIKVNAKDLTDALTAEGMGLSEEQLRAVAGGRMADRTATVTVSGVTKCCWG